MHGGKALVRIFARAGVDYIFSSPGTEWPPVWEALAEAQERGDNRLRYINCRHEALAVAMASGYTKVTGKPQAVLLHATAGPLNAAMFLRAAYQERVPMVICAGESSAFGEESRLPDPGNQWVHDLTDIGGPAELLRRCVKWSERVTAASILVPSVERAMQIAVEPPAGPVLLGVPLSACWMKSHYRRVANRTAWPAPVPLTTTCSKKPWACFCGPNVQFSSPNMSGAMRRL